MLPWQIFIACLCAGAAFATASNLPHPTLSHGLEMRQSTEGNCPKSFTAQNSLNFTTYCNQDNDEPNNPLRHFGTTNMIECMNHCSRYQGNGEGCFGIVWKETTKNCWLKNSTTSTGTLVPRKGVHSAYVASGEMDGYDSACPKNDLSVNSLPGVEGLHYTTHCGRFIDGDDECFSGYPCLATAFTGIFHARSLEQCLQICVDLHPLCRGVSYNPGLEIGFANCRPRTSFPESLSNPRSNMGIVHAATITRIDPIDQSCPSNKTYVASAARTSFEVRCGQLSMGSNITSVHTQNLTACMDACASSNSGCVGAQFDSSLAGGYNNCYLQNTTNVVMQLASATYAAVSNVQQIPPNSTSTEGKSKSSSKAWIAGPVVGGVAVAAAVVFAIFWVRRRNNTSKTTSVEKEGHTIGELDPAGAVCEMDAGPRHAH